MSEEKKSEVTEEVKEARKLSMEELEEVSGGSRLDPSDCVITYDGSISPPDVVNSSDDVKKHIR